RGAIQVSQSQARFDSQCPIEIFNCAGVVTFLIAHETTIAISRRREWIDDSDFFGRSISTSRERVSHGAAGFLARAEVGAQGDGSRVIFDRAVEITGY